MGHPAAVTHANPGLVEHVPQSDAVAHMRLASFVQRKQSELWEHVIAAFCEQAPPGHSALVAHGVAGLFEHHMPQSDGIEHASG